MTKGIFQKVKQDMIENKGFSINRCPKKIREEFLKYSEEEWADDRGAALTHLWKFFMGECSSGHEELQAKLDILADEITVLKTQVQQKEEEKGKIKRLDGKVR